MKIIRYAVVAAISATVGAASVGALDLPSVGGDECAYVARQATIEEPTLVNPDPDVTAASYVLYCGHTVNGVSASGTTTTKTERGLKVFELTPELSQQILADAADIAAGDGDVWVDR